MLSACQITGPSEIYDYVLKLLHKSSTSPSSSQPKFLTRPPTLGIKGRPAYAALAYHADFWGARPGCCPPHQAGCPRAEHSGVEQPPRLHTAKSRCGPGDGLSAASICHASDYSAFFEAAGHGARLT